MNPQKNKILIADDEWHLRLMLSSMLNKAGYQVVGEAANGTEAVSLFKEAKPDLLLMDINMPVMTGDVALREIMKATPDARIVMLTSVADMQTVEKCLDYGAVNYVRKDCPLDEIRTVIDEALSEDNPDG